MIINHYPVGWKDALYAKLLNLDDNIYLLVDGVHNESFYPKLKSANCFRYLPLYSSAPSADEETLGLGPVLVQHNTAHRKQWDTLVELTNCLPALSVIISPESIEELAQRLIPWCVVDADGYTLALSFADTRILPVLVNTLDDEQRKQFVGPALKWLYPGRDAAWLFLPVDPLHALPPSGGITLTTLQVAALTAASEADSIRYHLSQYVSKPMSFYSPFEAHTVISKWLGLADQLRMEASPDRLALCEFAVIRPGLEEDARYLALLESAPSAVTFEEVRQLLS
jgi:hypothetical protein